MLTVYGDLHIHIGKSSSGRRVKMMASGDLTFANIARESLTRKGLDLIGIVDCASLSVIEDIELLLAAGELKELNAGGMLYHDKLVILLGSEVELKIGQGFAHLLVYFPYLADIKAYADRMGRFLKNPYLSTQKAHISFDDWFALADKLHGIVIPAHAFTPHKGIYGNCVSSLSEVLSAEKIKKIPALELGLSADTFLAEMIGETSSKAFLSNSDAHSLAKIGREYNEFCLEKINFQEFLWALQNKNGRKIQANYGLDPMLGKYHRTYCPECEKIAAGVPPEITCSFCGSDKVVMGVLDRIVQIADKNQKSRFDRPEYHYQIPLEFIPGVGKKLLDKLISAFGSEMNVLHKATEEEIKNIAGAKIGEQIVLGRAGKLRLKPGGGGIYGRVVSGC